MRISYIEAATCKKALLQSVIALPQGKISYNIGSSNSFDAVRLKFRNSKIAVSVIISLKAAYKLLSISYATSNLV